MISIFHDVDVISHCVLYDRTVNLLMGVSSDLHRAQLSKIDFVKRTLVYNSSLIMIL